MIWATESLLSPLMISRECLSQGLSVVLQEFNAILLHESFVNDDDRDL